MGHLAVPGPRRSPGSVPHCLWALPLRPGAPLAPLVPLPVSAACVCVRACVCAAAGSYTLVVECECGSPVLLKPAVKVL